MKHEDTGMPPQLALDIRWEPDAALEDFLAGPNGAAVAAISAVAAGRQAGPVYLYGESATGKSHLLKGACRAVNARGEGAAYLPLDALLSHPPEVLAGMETTRVVAVDGLEAAAQSPQWQEALFHLFNRVRDAGGGFLAAGRGHPAHLGLALPDLVSRLRWGLVYRLLELSEADKKALLQRRARARGLEMPPEVLDYLLARHRRDAAFLFSALDRLDDASLRAQRRLTIPFVRRVLAGSAS
ncbi:DnaA regulatory inactivator Hda [Ectothiorhodospiraceae bacterium WFHF3C12]|nr:DnaA regulatory inactivator Hda [Ectothiorhodospiraceae bacterium WFHF3C12]